MENLTKKINDYYAELHTSAEMTANKNLDYALTFSDFKKVYYEYKKAEIALSIAYVDGDNDKIFQQETLLTKLKQAQVLELKKLSMTYNDIEPQYKCKLCNDTGYIGASKCKCFEKVLAKFSLGGIGIDLKKLPTFKDDTILKNENLTLTYEKFKQFTKKYPKTAYKHIIFTGTIGTSKTFLAACVANEILKKGYTTAFITSLQMNDIFIKYHSLFDSERAVYMDSIINADFLVIDDLGAGQNIKNITTEYLLTLINERDLKGNTTLITTNLTPDEILDKFHERVYSRLFNKKLSITLSFDGDDLRMKK